MGWSAKGQRSIKRVFMPRYRCLIVRAKKTAQLHAGTQRKLPAVIRRTRVRLIEMSDYNSAAKAYWSVMGAAGALTGMWGLYQCLSFTPLRWAQLNGLIFLVVVSSSYPIRI